MKPGAAVLSFLLMAGCEINRTPQKPAAIKSAALVVRHANTNRFPTWHLEPAWKFPMPDTSNYWWVLQQTEGLGKPWKDIWASPPLDFYYNATNNFMLFRLRGFHK